MFIISIVFIFSFLYIFRRFFCSVLLKVLFGANQAVVDNVGFLSVSGISIRTKNLTIDIKGFGFSSSIFRSSPALLTFHLSDITVCHNHEPDADSSPNLQRSNRSKRSVASDDLWFLIKSLYILHLKKILPLIRSFCALVFANCKIEHQSDLHRCIVSVKNATLCRYDSPIKLSATDLNIEWSRVNRPQRSFSVLLPVVSFDVAFVIERNNICDISCNLSTPDLSFNYSHFKAHNKLDQTAEVGSLTAFCNICVDTEEVRWEIGIGKVKSAGDFGTFNLSDFSHTFYTGPNNLNLNLEIHVCGASFNAVNIERLFTRSKKLSRSRSVASDQSEPSNQPDIVDRLIVYVLHRNVNLHFRLTAFSVALETASLRKFCISLDAAETEARLQKTTLIHLRESGRLESQIVLDRLSCYHLTADTVGDESKLALSEASNTVLQLNSCTCLLSSKNVLTQNSMDVEFSDCLLGISEELFDVTKELIPFINLVKPSYSRRGSLRQIPPLGARPRGESLQQIQLPGATTTRGLQRNWTSSFGEISLKFNNASVMFMHDSDSVTLRCNCVVLNWLSSSLEIICTEASASFYHPSFDDLASQVELVFHCIELHVLVIRKLENTDTEPASVTARIQAGDLVEFAWSPSLHRHIFNVLDYVENFREFLSLQAKLSQPTLPIVEETASSSGALSAETLANVSFYVQGRTIFSAQLADTHWLKFDSQQPIACVLVPKQSISVSCPILRIICDDAEIFTLSDASFTFRKALYLTPTDIESRKQFSALKNDRNDVVSISLEEMLIQFPYSYRFDLCYEELMTVVKWLRLKHRNPSSADLDLTPEEHIGRCPPDVSFKVKSFSFLVEDNPFEVRLASNFELLMDEMKEADVRERAMEAKLVELRNNYGPLTEQQTDELFRTLSKKTADIYISRWLQLEAQAPKKTSLFSWTISNLDLTVYADVSLLGKQCLTERIALLDPSPRPDDLSFSTLWGRFVNVAASNLTLKLRDYPINVLAIESCTITGPLVAAENEPAHRAKRECNIVFRSTKPRTRTAMPDIVQHPMIVRNTSSSSSLASVRNSAESDTIERSLTQLKFFHEFSAKCSTLNYAHGPCWEPIIQYFNQAFERVSKRSLDPSPLLPFWDKIRLRVHGHLRLVCDEMVWMYHVSLNPYNTRKLLDLTWTRCSVDWTNGCFVFSGDVDVYTKTASKYDDCRFLQLPSTQLVLRFDYVTNGNPLDHWSVMPCSPGRVPDYFSGLPHDSYRQFRTLKLNFSIDLKVGNRQDQVEISQCNFYASTIRWLDDVRNCLYRVSRPISSGSVFGNNRRMKKPFTRFFNEISLKLVIPPARISYWASFGRQHGAELSITRVTMESRYRLKLTRPSDGLKHRDRAEWSISEMEASLVGVEAHLLSADSAKIEIDNPCSGSTGSNKEVTRNFLFSLSESSYKRRVDNTLPNAGLYDIVDSSAQAILLQHIPRNESSASFSSDSSDDIEPVHKVQIVDLRVTWTTVNRDVVFGLVDVYNRHKTLKRNLSAEALTAVRVMEPDSDKRKLGRSPSVTQTGVKSPVRLSVAIGTPVARSPSYRHFRRPSSCRSSFKGSMASSIDSETENPIQRLHGVAVCSTEDVLDRKWLLEIRKPQVYLKGKESSSFIIACAESTRIWSCQHKPVWVDREPKSKSSWVGSIDNVQYFSPLNVKDSSEMETDKSCPIVWLPDDAISNPVPLLSFDIANSPVVTDTQSDVVSVKIKKRRDSLENDEYIKLQLLVPKCRCEFFLAMYEDINAQEQGSIALPFIQAISLDDTNELQEGANTFTILHHDFSVTTNSKQYHTIIDTVNDLVLYVQPQKKESLEMLNTLKFRLRLAASDSSDDAENQIAIHRESITRLQETLRQQLISLRNLECEAYLVQRDMYRLAHASDDISVTAHMDLACEMSKLEDTIDQCKYDLFRKSEELSLLIKAYRGVQLENNACLKALRFLERPDDVVVRRNEVCVRRAAWLLTQDDWPVRQPIAELELRDFLYTKLTFTEDICCHEGELGFVTLFNRDPDLPDRSYGVALDCQPQHDAAIKVLCRTRPPVSGITVNDLLEIQIMPLSLHITYLLYRRLRTFFFMPGAPEAPAGAKPKSVKPDNPSIKITKEEPAELRLRLSTFYDHVIPADDENIEEMKRRSARNMSFNFVKIAAFPITLSYRGRKEKSSILDLHSASLIFPALQYENEILQWLDLFNKVKNDCKRTLVAQVIKRKLHMRSNTSLASGEVSISSKKKDKNVGTLTPGYKDSMLSVAGSDYSTYSASKNKSGTMVAAEKLEVPSSRKKSKKSLKLTFGSLRKK